jgi:hypothetical protein
MANGDGRLREKWPSNMLYAVSGVVPLASLKAELEMLSTTRQYIRTAISCSETEKIKKTCACCALAARLLALQLLAGTYSLTMRIIELS